MSNITVKHFQLFATSDKGLNLQAINPHVQVLASLPAAGAGLRYDLHVKLTKAIEKAVKEFHEQRIKLCEELSEKKSIEYKDGRKEETLFEIIDADEKADGNNLIVKINDEKVEGKKILSQAYDLSKNKEEFDKRFVELLNLEIELDCKKIKLSKLDAEKDSSALDFRALENFIIDDRN